MFSVDRFYPKWWLMSQCGLCQSLGAGGGEGFSAGKSPGQLVTHAVGRDRDKAWEGEVAPTFLYPLVHSTKFIDQYSLPRSILETRNRKKSKTQSDKDILINKRHSHKHSFMWDADMSHVPSIWIGVLGLCLCKHWDGNPDEEINEQIKFSAMVLSTPKSMVLGI